ncbi:MAG: LuxR C-terminal-related transcriptional regulator [Gaiellaceae bacterium]
MNHPIDLRTTLQKVRVPSFVVDNTGVVTWLNDAASEEFGDLEGHPFSRIIASESTEFLKPQLDGTESATDYTTEVLMRDGDRRSAEVSSVAIDGGDRCHAIFGVVLVGHRQAPRQESPVLTARQAEVLALIANGASTVQIAESFHLSQETVRNHVRNILRRLGVHSRVEAVAVAYRDGLL